MNYFKGIFIVLFVLTALAMAQEVRIVGEVSETPLQSLIGNQIFYKCQSAARQQFEKSNKLKLVKLLQGSDTLLNMRLRTEAFKQQQYSGRILNRSQYSNYISSLSKNIAPSKAEISNKTEKTKNISTKENSGAANPSFYDQKTRKKFEVRAQPQIKNPEVSWVLNLKNQNSYDLINLSESKQDMKIETFKNHPQLIGYMQKVSKNWPLDDPDFMKSLSYNQYVNYVKGPESLHNKLSKLFSQSPLLIFMNQNKFGFKPYHSLPQNIFTKQYNIGQILFEPSQVFQTDSQDTGIITDLQKN